YQVDEKDGIEVTAALIDKKKVVVTEDIIQQDLRLDDADGVECLPTEEIFIELNEFSCSMASAVICLATVLINNQVDDLSSHTTKYQSPTLTQKVFANMRRIGKEFSRVETPLFATRLVQPQAATEEEDKEDEVPASFTPPSPTHDPSPPTNEPITSLPQKLLWVLRRMHPNRGRIKVIYDDEDITLVDMETKVELDAELQGRIERKDDDNAAAKEVNAVEPTVFDDEEVTMTMAQILIKMNAEKARILDDQMAKRLHDEEVEQAAAREKQKQDNFKRAQELQQQKYQNLKRKPIFVAQARKNMIVYLKNMAGYKIAHFKGMTYDQVRPIFEREYNKVQTFLKPDRDEESSKKRIAKETLLQESFKNLRAEVEVSGSHLTQDTPTNDPKEMSEEDVKNMLQIVLVSEFKVEALQVKVGGITQAYQSFEDMLKDFNREDLVALWRLTKENFSTAMPTEDKEKSIWVELKRLYEPNAADVLCNLQRYMHNPLTWKLYTNCGVHQVSSTRRHDIFMFPEKDYPLTNVVLLLMLSTKLQVDEDYEIARDLVMKIFMEANKPKSRRSLDTSSN
nr:hypothetical protein [Tanacetum cinerariifolium]